MPRKQIAEILESFSWEVPAQSHHIPVDIQAQLINDILAAIAEQVKGLQVVRVGITGHVSKAAVLALLEIKE